MFCEHFFQIWFKRAVVDFLLGLPWNTPFAPTKELDEPRLTASHALFTVR